MLIPANTAATNAGSESRPRFLKLKVGVLILLGLFLCIPVLLLFTLGIAKKIYDLKGFHIPSDALCPSICQGEYVFASMNAYVHRAPARGDVVMFAVEGENYLLVKRIIASAGEVVSQKGDKILVNGQVVHLPGETKVCGNIPHPTESLEDVLPFEPVTVPPGSYFVVGDNLNKSNDSRTPGFGFVALNKIRGKPLLIYMSSHTSRIGCGVS